MRRLRAILKGDPGQAQRWDYEVSVDPTYTIITRGTPLHYAAHLCLPKVGEVLLAAQAPAPQVLAYAMVDDATSKELCSAHVKETQIHRATGAILPRRIEFRWTMSDQPVKIQMTLEGLDVNPQISRELLFRRPIEGATSYNLGTGEIEKWK